MTTKIEQLKQQILACPKNQQGRKRYNPDLRQSILSLIESSRRSRASVCRDLGIEVATVHYWQKKSKQASFRQVAIVDKPSLEKPNNQDLTITSPKGFRLSGSYQQITRIWKDVHATAT